MLFPAPAFCNSPLPQEQSPVRHFADQASLASVTLSGYSSPSTNDSRYVWHAQPDAGSAASVITPGNEPPLETIHFPAAPRNWAFNQQNPPDAEGQKAQRNSPTNNSPGHIFWVVPAYKVDYGKNFRPLTTKEKFQEWAHGAYDPLGLSAGALEAATLEHSSSDGFCGYGHGFGNYAKCFGSLELDANVSSFIGDFALAALLHQDPRYFRLGQGSTARRLWYAIARVFVTYNDSGHTVFYSSALSGTVIAAGISNLYYPPQDVGAGHTVSRIAIDLGNTALYDAAAEFWPDIHQKLRHIF